MTSLSDQEIKNIFETFKTLNENPKGELFYTNAYTLLVAVMLSAQMTDSGVNKATKPLFEVADTPQKMLALGEKKLKVYIKSVNFFNTKAANVIKTSQILVDNFNGEVPNNQKALESFNGVGTKTANVVRSIAFNEPTIAVDTHVGRVANRTGLSSGKTPKAIEEDLKKIIPDDYIYNAHHWLILHGRYICKAKKPNCKDCPISHICKFENKIL